MGKKVDKEAMLGLEFETKNNGKCFIIDYKKYKDVTDVRVYNKLINYDFELEITD